MRYDPDTSWIRETVQAAAKRKVADGATASFWISRPIEYGPCWIGPYTSAEKASSRSQSGDTVVPGSDLDPILLRVLVELRDKYSDAPGLYVSRQDMADLPALLMSSLGVGG